MKHYREIVADLARESGVTNKQADWILRTYFKTIVECTREASGRIVVPDFGVFTHKEYKSRRVHNPQTGEFMDTPVYSGLKFRQSKTSKQRRQ